MKSQWPVAVFAVAVFVSSLGAIPIPPNVPVSGPQPDLQNEEQVWICPSDTSLVLTIHRDFRLGYRQIGLGRSANGGGSWTDTLIKPSYQIFSYQSDPVLTINSSGDYIACYLDYEPTVDYIDSSLAAFLVSQDCGLTWNGPYTVVDTVGPYFEDKQFITSDRTGGSHDGNIYISWTRFSYPEPTRIMFARSTTGATSFDDTVIVGRPFTATCEGGPPVSAGQFSQPLVGKDGAVYVFWLGIHLDSTGGRCDFYVAIRVNKSTDGGATWQGERTNGIVDGWNWLDGNVDVYSQPTTECDISNGPHSGNLYLQYRDTAAGSHDSEIMFRRSLDSGNTWSAPVRVNDDPAGPDVDQFHNWLVCNEEGVLVSVWYDQRTDPGHYNFDVFAAYSYDGGATWTSNHRVSSASIQPNLLIKSLAASPPHGARSPKNALSPMAGLIAEYIGVSCVSEKVVAVWTDTRDAVMSGSGQDVHSAAWNLPLTEPRLLQPVGGAWDYALRPDFRWAAAWKESDDNYRLQMAQDLEFSVILLDTYLDSNAFHGALENVLGDGRFYWRVKAFRGALDSTDFCPPDSFTLGPIECFCEYPGDIDGNGYLDAVDLAMEIDIIFFGAPDPQDPGCPDTRADFNCDGAADAVDLAAIIDHIFFGAAGPCNPCAK